MEGSRLTPFFWALFLGLHCTGSRLCLGGEAKKPPKPAVDYSKSQYKEKFVEKEGVYLFNSKGEPKELGKKGKGRKEKSPKKPGKSDSPYFLKQEQESTYLFDSKGKPKAVKARPKTKKKYTKPASPKEEPVEPFPPDEIPPELFDQQEKEGF